jgi:hypothetical protein
MILGTRSTLQIKPFAPAFVVIVLDRIFLLLEKFAGTRASKASVAVYVAGWSVVRHYIHNLKNLRLGKV